MAKKYHNSFSLFQWNCHGILNKKDALIQICNHHDILAISETWLSPDKPFYLNDFHILRKDGPSNRSGGTLLAIKKSISFTQIDSIFSLDGILESVAARISSPPNDLLIVSVYRHPTNSPPSIWENLFNSIPASGQLIVTGDLNAHHTFWGCNRSDTIGSLLFEAFQDFSLSLINDGTPTYISYFSHASSVIDLTLVSSSLTPYCSWSSLDDSFGSDHIPTVVAIDFPIQARTFFSHKLHTSKINRKLLFSSLLSALPALSDDLNSTTSPVEKYDIFCSSLTDTVTSLLSELNSSNSSSSARNRSKYKHNYKTQPSSRSHPPAPWWNEQCSDSVELRKQALRSFRKNPSSSTYLILKKQEANTRKVLRHAKRMGWRSFCESITSTTSISALWRVVKRFKSRFLNSSASSPTSNSGIPNEIQVLIDSISPSSCLHKLPSSLFNMDRPYTCRIFDHPFLLDELHHVIYSYKNKKSSPGLDQIDYTLLSNLPSDYYPLFLSILNNLFFTGYFPESWSHSLVYLIPKTTPGKFRPISLTSCCLKTLEKLILLRLDWWMEKYEKLPASQFGFRKYRSCQDNLAILTTEILTSFTRGTSTACLFLDLSNAFDDVIPFILISDLADLGLPPVLCRFIYSLIHARKLQFVVNGEITDARYSYKGVPQGSILSPILFNIYVSKLSKHIGEDCEVVQFADDIAIFVSSPHIEKALLELESSANRAVKFLTSKGLTVSSTKSSLMVFTKKHINPHAFSIKLGNSTILSTDTYKFLGISLDYRFSGRNHIRTLSSRCSKLLNIINMLRGTWWGGAPSSLLCIYKAFIRGSMEYGCLTFPFNNYSSMRHLESIQLRACLGLRRSTPTNVVLAEAGEGPLRFRFELLTSKYVLKTFALDSHPLIDKLSALLWYSRKSRKTDPSSKFLLFKSFTNLLRIKSQVKKFDFPAVYSIDYNALIHLPPVVFTSSTEVERIKNAPVPQVIFFEIYKNLISSHTCFYTDASKINCDEYVGFAIYSPSPHLQLLFKTHPHSSIFSAEALAILYTLEYILSEPITKSVIFTDSKSVTEALLSINLAHSYNHIIYAIKQKLLDIKSAGHETTIIWIPAHTGILGNETADYLAKRAISTGKLSDKQLPHSDFFSIPRRKYIESSSNILKIQDSSCQCGFPNQDADHIFWNCPQYDSQRTSLLRLLSRFKELKHPFKIQDILLNPISGVIHALLSFLKSCNLHL